MHHEFSAFRTSQGRASQKGVRHRLVDADGRPLDLIEPCLRTRSETALEGPGSAFRVVLRLSPICPFYASVCGLVDGLDQCTHLTLQPFEAVLQTVRLMDHWKLPGCPDR